jgi:hypothetical protein
VRLLAHLPSPEGGRARAVFSAQRSDARPSSADGATRGVCAGRRGAPCPSGHARGVCARCVAGRRERVSSNKQQPWLCEKNGLRRPARRFPSAAFGRLGRLGRHQRGCVPAGMQRSGLLMVSQDSDAIAPPMTSCVRFAGAAPLQLLQRAPRLLIPITNHPPRALKVSSLFL